MIPVGDDPVVLEGLDECTSKKTVTLLHGLVLVFGASAKGAFEEVAPL